MRFFLFIPFLILSITAKCQEYSSEELEVIDPINRLFTAMNEADPESLQDAFYSEASMFTVYKKNDSTQLVKGELSKFIEGISKAQPGMLEEKIWNLKIEIDPPLAQVWCDYALYVNSQFHHCGVDAFQLIQTSAGWKIFEVADTRRKEDCTEPPK